MVCSVHELAADGDGHSLVADGDGHSLVADGDGPDLVVDGTGADDAGHALASPGTTEGFIA